jgi:hypothetical protein
VEGVPQLFIPVHPVIFSRNAIVGVYRSACPITGVRKDLAAAVAQAPPPVVLLGLQINFPYSISYKQFGIATERSAAERPSKTDTVEIDHKISNVPKIKIYCFIVCRFGTKTDV